MYLMMSFSNNIVQTGMHTTGPFITQAHCETYASKTWTEADYKKEKGGPNFYDSNSIIHHLQHRRSNVVVFYTCVKIRSLDK